MAHIQLDNQADNNVSSKGNAYININDLCVNITYSADYSEQGERGEYWGGDLAVEGSVWIEVDSITGLQVTEIFDIETDDDLPLDSYTMTADDEIKIKQIIEDMICGIETETTPAYDYYA